MDVDEKKRRRKTQKFNIIPMNAIRGYRKKVKNRKTNLEKRRSGLVGIAFMPVDPPMVPS